MMSLPVVEFLLVTLPPARRLMADTMTSRGLDDDALIALAAVDLIAAMPWRTRWRALRFLNAHAEYDTPEVLAQMPLSLRVALMVARNPIQEPS